MTKDNSNKRIASLLKNHVAMLNNLYPTYRNDGIAQMEIRQDIKTAEKLIAQLEEA